MKTINACFSPQHFWLPVQNKSGKGMECYSCPTCAQKIYWSAISQEWVNVTKKEKTRNDQPVTFTQEEIEEIYTSSYLLMSDYPNAIRTLTEGINLALKAKQQ